VKLVLECVGFGHHIDHFYSCSCNSGGMELRKDMDVTFAEKLYNLFSAGCESAYCAANAFPRVL